MGTLFKLLAIGAWGLCRGVVFTVKIIFTYFIKCFREVFGQIVDEWKNRELDDEIY